MDEKILFNFISSVLYNMLYIFYMHFMCVPILTRASGAERKFDEQHFEQLQYFIHIE